MWAIGNAFRAGEQHAWGFTLLELIVVLAIVALMAGMVPLALGRALPGRRVAATAERLVALVDEAQAESEARGRPLRLKLVDRTLIADPSEARSALQPVSWADSTKVTLTDGLGRATPALVVYPDGSTDGAQFQVVDGSHQARVQVSALTGRITRGRVP